MNEWTILLVAMEKCIVRLPILYFWFDKFHLQYFDFCIQHPALFRETYYFINTIINSQPTTEWLKLQNHFYQCVNYQSRWDTGWTLYIYCRKITFSTVGIRLGQLFLNIVLTLAVLPPLGNLQIFVTFFPVFHHFWDISNFWKPFWILKILYHLVFGFTAKIWKIYLPKYGCRFVNSEQLYTIYDPKVS